MKIVIISLKTKQERRDFQNFQLQNLSLDFEFFDAISSTEIDGVRPETYWRTGRRPMRDAEKACFLSHRLCWEEVLKSNEPQLILEDDVLLSQELPNFLRHVQDSKSMDIISLETRGRKKLLAKQNADQTCRKMFMDRDGAAAYILWPSGAKKIIEDSDKTVALADTVLWTNFKLDSYQSYPALALQADRCSHYDLPEYLQTQTSIPKIQTGFKKRGDTLLEYLKYRTRRFWDQVNLAGPQISHLIDGKKERMEICKQDFEYLVKYKT